MPRSSFSRSILAVATFVLAAGCESSSEPIAPSSALESAANIVPASAVAATATGSGHYMSGGELRTFAFSAVGREDGSASGQYEIVIHAIDRFLHVDVTCMVVRNDTAWVAGIIDRTNHPAIIEGSVSYFWAVDNGEGAGVVEKVSTARINDRVGEDQRFCSLTPDEAFSGLPGNVILHGNVQVQGR
jgi:hypothetical protein